MSGYGDYTDGAYVSNQALDSQVHYYYHVDTLKGATETGGVSNGFETLDSYRPTNGSNNYAQYSETLGTYASANGLGRWGVELAFGRTLAANSSDEHAIIKISHGGTRLERDWNPGAWNPNTNPTGGEAIWQNWLTETTRALNLLEAQGYDVEIASFTWLQGEGDSNDEASALAYEDNYRLLLSSVESHMLTFGYSTEDTVFLNPSFSHGRDDLSNLDEVRAAQQAVMGDLANGYYIDNSALNSTDDYFDRIHYNGASLNLIGTNMANTFLSASSVPEPTSVSLLGLGAITFVARRSRVQK